jgi:hypothetical protein
VSSRIPADGDQHPCLKPIISLLSIRIEEPECRCCREIQKGTTRRNLGCPCLPIRYLEATLALCDAFVQPGRDGQAMFHVFLVYRWVLVVVCDVKSLWKKWT